MSNILKYSAKWHCSEYSSSIKVSCNANDIEMKGNKDSMVAHFLEGKWNELIPELKKTEAMRTLLISEIRKIEAKPTLFISKNLKKSKWNKLCFSRQVPRVLALYTAPCIILVLMIWSSWSFWASQILPSPSNKPPLFTPTPYLAF